METVAPYLVDSAALADEQMTPVARFLEEVDCLRRETSRRIAPAHRAEHGQFFTPMAVARRMASLLTADTPEVRLLDAGAGIGSLSAACVAELCLRKHRPRAIHIVAYEIEPLFIEALRRVGELCREQCARVGIAFSLEIRPKDFIEDAAEILRGGLFNAEEPGFTAAVLNPPYRKIHSASASRLWLRRTGVETTNLYTGFLALTMRLLSDGGELVAITPRSFCNGTYFRPFRQLLLQTMTLRHIHLYKSRQEAFRDDEVLQETIIVHAVKGAVEPERVIVTTGADNEEDVSLHTEMPYTRVVHPDDPERFIRVVSDGLDERIGDRMAGLPATLHDLALTASTGRVVDFRAANFLRATPDVGAAPLLYPVNLADGGVRWPVSTKKPQALVVSKETELLLIPNETYVLVKRFSAKEERRRLVASVYEGGKLPGRHLGIENHINYFHANGRGTDLPLAQGLALYLNSTFADVFFRQFSGHTQVNATDLRNLRYPTAESLRRLGNAAGATPLTQDEIDAFIRQEIFDMAEDGDGDPIQTKRRIEEAQAVLTALDLPKPQRNERSALTLLALLDLKPGDAWSVAANPQRGTHAIMAFMRDAYGKSYAPNTRETIRRQTLHQFIDAGLVVYNTDQPDRPTNSGKFAYRVADDALTLLRVFGTPKWDGHLGAFLAANFTLHERYAQERYTARPPVTLPSGVTLSLSGGGQNPVIKEIIEQFAPRFTPGGHILYVGDTDTKFAHFEMAALQILGVHIREHGKMPDVILHHTAKNWLVLVEAVTSHGPINPKRKAELEALFETSSAGLVFVTAFQTRQAMRRYLPEIAWETDVWAADAPDHLIHFSGERFLGPY